MDDNFGVGGWLDNFDSARGETGEHLLYTWNTFISWYIGHRHKIADLYDTIASRSSVFVTFTNHYFANKHH